MRRLACSQHFARARIEVVAFDSQMPNAAGSPAERMHWGAERSVKSFQRIDVRDSRTGLITRTHYEQNFPLTGRVSRLEVLRDNGSKLLASVDTVHRSRQLEATQYNERYYPWVEQVTQRTYEAEGPEQLVATSQVTINEADIDFQTGNTRLVTTTATSPETSGASTSSIRTDYFPATNNCSDLPQRITSTQQMSAQPAIARVVEFTPDGSQCRHLTGTVRGTNNNSHYDVTFTYGYDSYGNLSSVREQAQEPDAQGNYQPMPVRETQWTLQRHQLRPSQASRLAHLRTHSTR